MADFQYTSNVRAVIALIKDTTPEALRAMAFEIEGETKHNIRTIPWFDTGFMMNSTYTAWPGGSGYGTARSAAIAAAAGRGARREMAGVLSPKDDNEALVHVAAIYAIWLEQKKSFLFLAAQMVARRAKAIVVPVYRQVSS